MCASCFDELITLKNILIERYNSKQQINLVLKTKSCLRAINAFGSFSFHSDKRVDFYAQYLKETATSLTRYCLQVCLVAKQNTE